MNLSRNPFVWCALIATLLASAGCGGRRTYPVSMSLWHSGVQKYVAEQGNGDMNSLREVEVAPHRPGFRLFSREQMDQSHDIAGVLVGVHEFGGRPWYLYLVGEIEEQSLQSIHPAAVAQDGPRFLWRSGPADPDALLKYQEARGQSGQALSEFPSPADAFEWQGQGDMITLREKTSGAEWTLDLAAQPQDQ